MCMLRILRKLLFPIIFLEIFPELELLETSAWPSTLNIPGREIISFSSAKWVSKQLTKFSIRALFSSVCLCIQWASIRRRCGTYIYNVRIQTPTYELAVKTQCYKWTISWAISLGQLTYTLYKWLTLLSPSWNYTGITMPSLWHFSTNEWMAALTY